MANFQWEATNRAGEKRKGVVEAESAESVESRLRGEGMTVQRVKKEAKEIVITIGSGVSSKDLQIFTRQLATMIDAGLPLVQCLDILANQTPNKAFARNVAPVSGSSSRMPASVRLMSCNGKSARIERISSSLWALAVAITTTVSDAGATTTPHRPTRRRSPGRTGT